MQRLAAVAAMILRRGIRAQPMAAGLALRIDALYGPSWQVAHAASPGALLARAGTEWLDSAPCFLWGQEQTYYK